MEAACLDLMGQMHDHMKNMMIQRTKRGYVNGEEEQLLYLMEGRGVDKGDGRWLVRYKGEISYVAPELFQMLYNNITDKIIGQTLEDGTVMTKQKIISKKASDKTETVQPTTDTEGTKKRKRRVNNEETKTQPQAKRRRVIKKPQELTPEEIERYKKKDVWLVARPGTEHVEVIEKIQVNNSTKEAKKDTRAVDRMDRKNKRLAKNVTDAADKTRQVTKGEMGKALTTVPSPEEYKRASIADALSDIKTQKEEKTLARNYEGVQVYLIGK